MAQLLLTRPQEASDRFAAQLTAAGVDLPLVIAPLLRIDLAEAPQIAADQTVVFTSRYGVLAAPAGQGRLAYVVGSATGAAAEAAGYRVRLADGDAEALIRRILADHQAGEVAGPLVHLRGAHSRGDLVARLSTSGLKTHDTVVYDQIAQPLTEAAKTLLTGSEPVILPLFSPRTAALFMEQMAEVEVAAPLFVAFISPAAAASFDTGACTRHEVLPNPRAEEMIAAVQRLMAAAHRLEGEIPQR
ncbi:uroporphyrinogen-III synthase [Thalassobius sp. MITS945101]|uniref:uroporphyrinogen-III synthase n=1 Tax=Thalassobius sp. MITS945101 TaxID=3096994 RepID=UPI003999573C